MRPDSAIFKMGEDEARRAGVAAETDAAMPIYLDHAWVAA